MRVCAVAVATLLSAMPALAEDTAAFLGTATYTTADGCDKLKALVGGAERNLSTVPQTLTAKGYEGWEHSCSIKSVVEKAAGKAWTVVTACAEGDAEWDDTQNFEKLEDGRFKVTAEGETEPAIYAVCDAPAAPKGQ